MQAKKRYILLSLSGILLIYCYYGTHHFTSEIESDYIDSLPSFATPEMLAEAPPAQPRKPRSTARPCRMETCFDFSKCGNDPKVYVYPTDGPVSASYRKVLSAVRESNYVTQDPTEACLLLPAVDTLDADPLSSEYVADVGARLSRLPYWNNGRNHIIFNLYAGTWPDYAEDALGFDPGEAILARASASETIFRHGFDVSLPLFHKQHPERGGAPPAAPANTFPATRRHLLAFKGKRYVHGIGSETRNSLWHLHDGDRMVLVTTCRHGKSWKDLRDERCDEDNREYDKFDYGQLLSNSTFCLVARGRRLGSYRFLEALAAGCVPVLLSNGWRLPFDERIDWRRAVIWADERLLLQVPELVRSVPPERILALRQQTQLLWEQYFSSIEKIVFTTIEIVVERILAHRWSRQREALVWNAAPGALATPAGYADCRAQLPAPPPPPPPAPAPPPPAAAPLPAPLPVHAPAPPTLGAGYTALVYVQASSPALHKLLANLAKSEFCEKVVVVWDSGRAAPALRSLARPARDALPVHVVDATTHYPGAGVWARWRPLWAVATAAVFSLDGDAPLLADELDFAYSVWRHFPERLVGYPARTHYWDEAKGAWGYSSRWGAQYSLVLAGAALVHRAHLAAAAAAPPRLRSAVAAARNCEDLLLAGLVARATRRPPIKLAQRTRYKPHHHNNSRSSWSDPEHFVQRQSCLNTFAAAWGELPLPRSVLRLDPLLFKDPVSNLRKKYRKMELVS
ncbi:exostosin-1 isoform X1 [Plutella xylostella]|uniref:exostosin-1 isoform X1 n=1 Tax=Plutella xylostella TaxID=51655 RepID=UPI0020331BE4|nr:exostosin-1 isoform X1 [Plutella xylostella]XP_048489266.1 exostosin-1 isoform X1 [Plutella xylostella]XP_048489267.1 exostosin-1 isoform X1 [Plutella xylostella]